MKQRTQILLDPPQYDFLKSLSRREGKGLGELVRQFVEEKRQLLLRKGRRDSLSKLIGSFHDKECTSENYEEFLYGKKRS
ncbi:MAG: hypothetical protein HYY44_05350 [Deltaproteobacteria bacterium]|nr:hypothetical protein [Deltaproteobacteria bacterium]